MAQGGGRARGVVVEDWMKPEVRLREAKRLLTQLSALLREEGETNLIRGINSALASLEDGDGERGYAEARRIYRHMVVGRGPFSDYYIQRTDWAEQQEANEPLDRLRDELWWLFDTP